VALSNTTVGMLLATVNASIVIISLPAIFNGIHLDPLAPGNVSYLLWMLMGFLLVSAVLVVALGPAGDMFGRVKLYNLGFVVFTLASIALSLDPLQRAAGALWLIGWRVVAGGRRGDGVPQLHRDPHRRVPGRQRGMALGINQVAAIAGSFIGLVLGGVLAEWDWRAVFWVSVPIGILGTVWSYLSLHELGERNRAGWTGGATSRSRSACPPYWPPSRYGIQPYGGHSTGWTNPWVLAGIIGGVALLVAFCVIESRVVEPMFHLTCSGTVPSPRRTWPACSPRSAGWHAVHADHLAAGHLAALHGYDYASHPLWAGIYLLPLTAGFLIAGPVSGWLSDRFGVRPFAVGGALVVAASFVGWWYSR